MVNYTGFYKIVLWLLILFNLGFFVDFPITKLPYLPLFLLIVYFLLRNLTYLNFSYSYIFTFVTGIFYFNFIKFSVPIFWEHLLFLGVLTILWIFVHTSIENSIFDIRVINPLIKKTLFISLIIAIADSLLKQHQAGWVWPINIALQEITLIGLLFSNLILNGGLKQNWKITLLFLVLLLLRESGKATFIAIMFSLFLVYRFRYKYSLKKFNRYLVLVYLGQLGFSLIAYFGFVYLSDLNNDILSYTFNKRFSLIIDGMSFLLSSPYTFLFGGGFGANNYVIQNPNLLIQNAPQLFILTTAVFGGILFTLLLICVILRLPNYLSLKLGFNPERFIYLHAYILCLAIVTSFHEYFNNPFVYLSIAMVITAYKSKNIFELNLKNGL